MSKSKQREVSAEHLGYRDGINANTATIPKHYDKYLKRAYRRGYEKGTRRRGFIQTEKENNKIVSSFADDFIDL